MINSSMNEDTNNVVSNNNNNVILNYIYIQTNKHLTTTNNIIMIKGKTINDQS